MSWMIAVRPPEAEEWSVVSEWPTRAKADEELRRIWAALQGLPLFALTEPAHGGFCVYRPPELRVARYEIRRAGE